MHKEIVIVWNNLETPEYHFAKEDATKGAIWWLLEMPTVLEITMPLGTLRVDS